MRKFNGSLIIFLSLIGFIFYGCFKWGARDFENFPHKKTALDKTYVFEGNVLIVGGGASGLAAAKILERNNIDYQILEATNLHGARLKKNETLADFPIEVDAEWLHNRPQVRNRLKGKDGDDIYEVLIPNRLKERYNWDEADYENIPQKDLSDYFEFFPDNKFKHST